MGRGTRKKRPTDGSQVQRQPVSCTPSPLPIGKTGRFSGWQAGLLRLALCILAPILLFSLLEAGLRLGGYGYPTGFFLGPDASGTFVTNHKFGWRFFPRSLARNPQRCILGAKPAGSIRIFVLGSSAAMGTPDAAYSFGRILEVMLRERYPGQRFEVVNAAMTAINSHVTREIARDCAAREPDVFVVYMGNNEVVGPYGPGTVFQQWSPGLRWVRASLWVKATRVGQLLGDVSGSLRRDKGAPNRWRGMEMFTKNPVAFDDPRLAGVYANYRQNLSDICRFAKNAGASVVLSTVAVNLRGCPPLASRHRSDLLPAELANWESMYRAGSELASESNRLSEAIGQFEAAAKIDDRFAELQFRIGECMLKSGRQEEARARLEMARDLDVLRFRADSHINAVIRDVARTQAAAGVRLIDAERLFAESDPDVNGLVGENLFYEHVHLTFDGSYLLARAVFDQVCEALPQLAPVRKQGAVPSRQRCAELLTLTAWDDYQLLSKMVEMTSREPFTGQLNHGLRQAAARQRLDDLRRLASTPQAKAAAWKAYEEALAKAPDDWQLHRHFGMFAMQIDRPEVAVRHLRLVVEKIPWDPSLRGELGNALVDHGKLDEAIVHYRKALELNPGNVEGQNTLGATLLRNGCAEEAIQEFLKVLEINPDFEVTYNNLGSALVSRGQLDEAIAQYQKALELKPDYAEAYKNLGKVFLQKGSIDKAITYFKKAVERKPEDAEIQYKLGQVLAGLGRTDEAIGHYRKAVEFKPDDVAAHNNLGILLAGRGQVDAAMAHYLKVLELKPDHAPAHSNLGGILFQKGQTNEALEHFRKSVELKPDNADAQVNLGVALRSVGKGEEAIPHFRRALELQPGNAEARKKMNTILKPAFPR